VCINRGHDLLRAAARFIAGHPHVQKSGVFASGSGNRLWLKRSALSSAQMNSRQARSCLRHRVATLPKPATSEGFPRSDVLAHGNSAARKGVTSFPVPAFAIQAMAAIAISGR
jgi:hypothetical protein